MEKKDKHILLLTLVVVFLLVFSSYQYNVKEDIIEACNKDLKTLEDINKNITFQFNQSFNELNEIRKQQIEDLIVENIQLKSNNS